jgi:DNA replication protein DnaC
VELKQHLIPKLKHLRLSGILDTLEVRSQQAQTEHWTYADFLERLLEDEVERRAQKQLAMRLRRAELASDKTLETFDFTFNPGINRQRVYDLATCQFIHEKRNVLLCGPTGVGKTHLAQALAHSACRQDFDVVFTSAHTMLRHLHAGRADGTYEKRLMGFVRPELLVIDDFGLKPLTSPGPEDLYDVINERYEKGSILITSNRAPGEWAGWFADPLLASAGLDRLAHNAHVLIITGASYRTHGREPLAKEVVSTSTANP